MPDKGMAPDSHTVILSELHQFIGTGKFRSSFYGVNKGGFHAVFRYNHIEFTFHQVIMGLVVLVKLPAHTDTDIQADFIGIRA